MSDKEPSEFEKFDKVMRSLLAVPYAELQKELEKAVAAEKEFGLTELEWPDEVFLSFGALLSHVEAAIKHPAIAPESLERGR